MCTISKSSYSCLGWHDRRCIPGHVCAHEGSLQLAPAPAQTELGEGGSVAVDEWVPFCEVGKSTHDLASPLADRFPGCALCRLLGRDAASRSQRVTACRCSASCGGPARLEVPTPRRLHILAYLASDTEGNGRHVCAYEPSIAAFQPADQRVPLSSPLTSQEACNTHVHDAAHPTRVTLTVLTPCRGGQGSDGRN